MFKVGGRRLADFSLEVRSPMRIISIYYLRWHKQVDFPPLFVEIRKSTFKAYFQINISQQWFFKWVYD
jgi:hypothetical protein